MKTLQHTAAVFVFLAAAAITSHLYLLDGLDGWLFARLMGDDTTYAPGYSDSAFRRVRVGMDRRSIDQLLGPPLREVWIYREHGVSLPSIDFDGDRAVHVGSEADARLRRVKIGMTKADVKKLVGVPREVSLVYTTTLHDQSYHIRAVTLATDRVVKKSAEFYVD